jgi:LysM repeat protein
MNRTARSVRAVLASLAILSLSAAAAPAADPPGFETYVVRRGDTLSKIAGRVFGDAGRWREILKANPQVTNANRIYPGDSLLVPAPAASAAVGAEGLAAGAGAEAGGGSGSQAAVPETGAGAVQGEVVQPAAAPAVEAAAAPVPPPVSMRPVPVVNPATYRAAGSITDRLPQLVIVAGEDERDMLATGDAAIVNAPITPGERFTVVRAERRVFHPRTGEDLGWLIRVLGTAEVTCRGERTSTVMLGQMRFAAGVGDYLVPFDPADKLEQNQLGERAKPQCIAPGAADGVVVAFEEDRLAGTEQEFAYIDQGTTAGVAPGRRFVIYRPIAPEGALTVGELQVLRVGARTATALITTSIHEVQLGDRLQAR